MLLTNNYIENKKQLLEIFISGCKTTNSIGVETEKLLIYKDSKKAIKYQDVVNILKSFDQNKWERIYEKNNLVGLKSTIGTISLEPGSQIELSLIPIESLEDIETKIKQYYQELNYYADKNNAIVLDSGIQPVSTYNNIEIIPKKRYEYMTKYLPTQQLEPFIMMRETAGIQANFDYKTEEDAIKKLSLALKMSPIISAIYSNSPVRNSKLTQYKSNRANSWLNVDNQRCGLVSKKLFDDYRTFSFSDYVEILLDIPMIFIQRENEYFETKQTFREFMQNGYMNLNATLSDWYTHLSLYFPDVRLKNYIEIRNHDAQNTQMTLSVPAFWKGIIYNPLAMDEIEKILSKFTYEDFMELRENTPKYGINAKLKNYFVLDFVKEFFNISYDSLKENQKNEEKYLEPVFEYITLKRMPADNFEK